MKSSSHSSILAPEEAPDITNFDRQWVAKHQYTNDLCSSRPTNSTGRNNIRSGKRLKAVCDMLHKFFMQQQKAIRILTTTHLPFGGSLWNSLSSILAPRPFLTLAWWRNQVRGLHFWCKWVWYSSPLCQCSWGHNCDQTSLDRLFYSLGGFDCLIVVREAAEGGYKQQ